MQRDANDPIVEAMRARRYELRAKPLDRVYRELFDAAAPALLASLASKEGEIAELRARLDRSRDEYHRKVDHDLTQARAERDEWKDACRRAGVCMSCATSNRDPMGCTDCLNTGWNGGEPIEAQEASARAEAAESRLTTALAERDEALERAATKATSFLVGDPENGVPFRSPMPHEIADAIRKMKALS